MSSTSAAQEERDQTEHEGIKTKCENTIRSFPAGGKPEEHKCDKTILIDGKMKCDRCYNETSLAQLQAMRLLNGETTHKDYMQELGQILRKSREEEPPGHRFAREIMGENFISLPEALRAFWERSEFYPDEYLKLLRIPFSRETLEDVRNTHWLMPIVPWLISEQSAFNNFWEIREKYSLKEMAYGGRYKKGLCQCHHDWKDSATGDVLLLTGKWILLEKNNPGHLSRLNSQWRKLQDSAKGLANVSEILYADNLLRKTKRGSIVNSRFHRIWARPIVNLSNVGEALEFTSISLCEHGKLSIDIFPPSYEGGGQFISYIQAN